MCIILISFLCLAGSFSSDSDSDSDHDKRERRIHVNIKPLNNGQAPMSASVDELRATVENISLSPTGVFSVKFIFILNFLKQSINFFLYFILPNPLNNCSIVKTCNKQNHRQGNNHQKFQTLQHQQPVPILMHHYKVPHYR